MSPARSADPNLGLRPFGGAGSTWGRLAVGARLASSRTQGQAAELKINCALHVTCHLLLNTRHRFYDS